MKWLMVLFTCLALTGCGGSSSDSGSDTSTIGSVIGSGQDGYSLAAVTSTAVGTVFTGPVEGVLITGSGSSEITGTISIANRGLTSLDGISVYQRDISISIIINGVFDQIVVESFTDEAGNSVSRNNQGVACGATSSGALPDTVKIGDFGTLSTVSCSDGNRFENSWVAEKGEGTDVMLLMHGRQFNGSGTEISSVTAGYGISTSGVITEVGMQVVGSDGSNLVLGTP